LSALFRLRKTRRRLVSDSKGFSSIVGAIFAVLVMISLISTVFVWSLSQNTLYNNTATQTRQADLDRSNEKTVVLNTTYTPYNNSNVNVYAQIQNIGSSSIQFITVWLYVSNSTPWTNYNFSSLANASVQGGSIFTLNVNLTATGVNPNSTYSISSWLITARGNTVALQQKIFSSTVIISSQVTQGIGSIAMDFKQFNHYDFTSNPANGTTLPSPTKSFSLSSSNYSILALLLTNYDSSGEAINLTGSSYIWAITAQASTLKGNSWSILKVANGKIITAPPFSSQLLPYKQPTWVYFGPTQPSWLKDNVVPVNILLFGNIGSDDFGQNIPFVALNVLT